MNEEVKFYLDEAEEQMQKAIAHLETELVKIRAGRANAQMLEGVFVEYYGTNAPLNNVSGVSTPDPRTLVVQPFEKSMLVPIEKAWISQKAEQPAFLGRAYSLRKHYLKEHWFRNTPQKHLRAFVH